MNPMLIQFICLFIAILIATLFLEKQKPKQNKIEIKETKTIDIKIDDEIIKIMLYNNENVSNFYETLPVEAKLDIQKEDRLIFKIDKEVNKKLDNVRSVKKGEIVLDENNNIVIFLENMECNKNYSKIGIILLINKIDNFMNSNNKTIIFEKGDKNEKEEKI